MEASPEPLPAARPRAAGLVRRVWPWLVGLAILAIVATRIPFDAFVGELRSGPHLVLAAVDLLVVSCVLVSDSVSTWVGLVALRLRRPLREVLAVRGATYLLFLVNYALGQGGFGYYLHRTGLPALRAAGATLFLIGTNLATLLIVTTVAWWVYGPEADPRTWFTLLAGCAAFGVYLVVIAMRPRPLVRRALLAPLFEAGIRGHALAMLGRLPHVTVMVVGHWLALRAWGIPVPFGLGVTIMPLVVIASVLPISPAGLGTAQAALVYFLQDHAAKSTVLAFGIVHFVYGIAASLLVGLICTPFARRVHAAAQPVAAPAITNDRAG